MCLSNEIYLYQLYGEDYAEAEIFLEEKYYSNLEKRISEIGESIDYLEGLWNLHSIIYHKVKIDGFISEGLSASLKSRAEGLSADYRQLGLDLISKIESPEGAASQDEFQAYLQAEFPPLVRELLSLWSHIYFKPEYQEKLDD